GSNPPRSALLQDDFLSLRETLDDFGSGSVTDAYLYWHSPLAARSPWRWNFNCGIPLRIINDGFFRNDQSSLVFFEHDLGIRRHVSSQFTGGIVDRHFHFKADDIVL